jgi:hypothetical protein
VVFKTDTYVIKDQNLIGFRQGNKNQKEGWL